MGIILLRSFSVKESQHVVGLPNELQIQFCSFFLGVVEILGASGNCFTRTQGNEVVAGDQAFGF